MRSRFPIQFIYLLCTMYTARAVQLSKLWTIPLKNSVRLINHRCHNLIKQSRVMGQKERFCCIDREKMNYIYNLGTHTINTFWTQLIGGPLCILTLWHLEYIAVCVQQFYIMGRGRERQNRKPGTKKWRKGQNKTSKERHFQNTTFEE